MPKTVVASRLYKIRRMGRVSPGNALDWAITFWLGVTLLCATWNLGGYLPFGRPMIPITLMVSGLAILHGLWVLFHRGSRLRFNTLGFVFVPFLVYFILNCEWLSPTPWVGRRQILAFAEALVIYWVVIHNLRTKQHVWFLVGLLLMVSSVALAAGFWQNFADPYWIPLGRQQVEQYLGRASGTFGVPNSFAALLGIQLPFILLVILVRKLDITFRILFSYFAVLSVTGIVMSGSRGSWFSLVPVIVLLPLFVSQRKKTRQLLWATILPLGLLLGTLLYWKSDLVEERITQVIVARGDHVRPIMWKAALQIFAQHPLLGSGAGSYNDVFEKFRPDNWQHLPRYAHNDYLNTLSDLGLLGFLLLFTPAGYIAWLGYRHWRLLPYLAVPRGERRRVMPTSKLFLGGGLLGLFGFSVHLLVDFHLKIPALLFLVAVFLGLTAKFARIPTVAFPESRSLSGLLFGLWLILAAWLVASGLPSYAAAHQTWIGREMLDELFADRQKMRYNRAHITETIEMLEQAVEWDPDNAEAWANLSLAVLQLYWLDPTAHREVGQRARRYAEKAIALSDQLWYAWSYLGWACDIIPKPLREAHVHYARAVELAPNNAHAWFYYAKSLSYDRNAGDRAREAVQKVLYLDPDHESGIRLKASLGLP